MFVYGGTRSPARPTVNWLSISKEAGSTTVWAAEDATSPAAEPLVTAFADALRSLGAQVDTGVFGADMQVGLVNDGPVTVLLESP